MPYKDLWGEKAKERSAKRREYFKEYSKLRKQNNPEKVRAEKRAWFYRQTGKLPGERGLNRVGIGYAGEELIKNLLADSILVRKPSHDIEWNGFTVEVKTANKHKKWNMWEFNIKLSQKNSDYIAIVCRENETVKKAFLFPMEMFRRRINKDKNGFQINANDSKYDKFRVQGST